MLAGLVVITGASAARRLRRQLGAGGAHAVHLLLVLRALEGVGFLLAVMPGPGLIRAMSPPGAEKAALGLWGAYMPLGVALALLLGPALIAWAGWPGWWWVLSLVSAAAAVWVALAVPADDARSRGRRRRRSTGRRACATPSRAAGPGRWRWPSPSTRRNGWR